MDALILPLSEFSKQQINQHQLMKTASRKSEDSELMVTFWRRAEPSVIPFFQNDEIKLTPWAGVYPESLLEDGTIHGAEPKPVEIPALYGVRKHIWFKVPPHLRIRGIIVPGIDRISQIYILTKRSCNFFEQMTKSDIEPVYTGTNLYHDALS